MDRREMIKASIGTAAMTALGIPLAAKSVVPAEGQAKGTGKKKILVIGAHPDDPETCAGGTMCLLASAGHEVVSVYLTRGEAGIKGKSHSDAAAIRVEEAMNACEVMGTRCVFMNQIDGSTEINKDRYREMQELLAKEKPDVVITHWPIDSHRDHAVCGLLVLDAWKKLGRCFKLYYFEPMTGTQSQLFHPTDWVDISSVVEQKHKACDCHISQGIDYVMEKWHTPMERFRGLECRCTYAEAFIHHTVPGTIL